MGDDDPQPTSLEYIEDSYLPSLPQNATPSLDELSEFDNRSLYDESEWSVETELFLQSMPLEQIFCISDEHPDDFQKVEAELSALNDAGSIQNKKSQFLKKLFSRKSVREVRVTFIDLSKPYLAKISSNDNYKSFLNIGSNGKWNY